MLLQGQTRSRSDRAVDVVIALRRRIGRDPVSSAAALFLVLVLVGSVGAGLSPYEPTAQDTRIALADPSLEHPLGTDHLGRDIFTRLLHGSRTTLFVGLVAVGFGLSVGTLLGAMAGYRGGRTETVIMRSIDVVLSFPLMLLAIVVVAVLGPGVGSLVVAIGVSQTPLFARLAHALALTVRTREFIVAAVSIGLPDGWIMRRHVLPNIIAPIVVQATAVTGVAILYASALSFLGLGIQPPTPDWGAMVADFRRFIFDRPQMPFYPGAAIALTVLALNLVGDALVDLLDPMARKSLA